MAKQVLIATFVCSILVAFLLGMISYLAIDYFKQKDAILMQSEVILVKNVILDEIYSSFIVHEYSGKCPDNEDRIASNISFFVYIANKNELKDVLSALRTIYFKVCTDSKLKALVNDLFPKEI